MHEFEFEEYLKHVNVNCKQM